jgi:hypothetical protein
MIRLDPDADHRHPQRDAMRWRSPGAPDGRKEFSLTSACGGEEDD